MPTRCKILREVDDLLGDDPCPKNLSIALEQLSTKRAEVGDWLGSLRSQNETYRWVTGKSYWHCNGFARIMLFATARYAVRLHVWPAIADRHTVVNPHGHRWEFSSWVAAGSGMTESYFLEADGSEPTAAAYQRYDYDGPGPLRGHDELAWLREDARFTHAPGTIYTCSSDILHTVVPIDDAFGVTIVLQGPAVAASTRVYVRPGSPSQGAERSMTAAELDALLAQAETAIRQPT